MKFIYGEENYLISKELKNIKDSISVEPILYNDDSDTADIISEIATVSLFQEHKLIFLKNIIGLSKDSESEEIIKELSNIDESNLTVVFIYQGKINKKNKLVKFLLQKAEIKECNKLQEKDIISMINDVVKVKNGTISASASIALASKLPNNMRIIIQEIEKLLLESMDITKEQIENSIGDYAKENHFALPNALVTGNSAQILSAYKEKIDGGEEVISIISQIASTFNLAYKVMIYKNRGFTNQVIADDLGVHIFRIKKSTDITSSTTEEKIKQIIIMLSDIDKNIKNGSIEPNIALDNFILNLVR